MSHEGHIFFAQLEIKKFNIDLPEQSSTYESRCFDLGSCQILAVSFWNSSPQLGGQTHFYFRKNSESHFVPKPILQLNTEHVRNYALVKTKWGMGILMADHGLDVPPFEGGKLSLVVYENSMLVDKSDYLPREREFYFDLCAFNENDEPNDSVIITALDNGRTKPKYLKFTESGIDNLTEELPPEWLGREKYFMSVCEIPQQNELATFLALGKVDFIPARGIKNEIIFKNKSERWALSDKFEFDAIKKKPEWGTVKMRVGKVKNEEPKSNLICLNHDFGFKNADIQLYEIEENHLRPVLINNKHPQFENGPFYLHDAVFCDLDGDGEREILISCRAHSNWDFEKWQTDLFVLKRMPDLSWHVFSLHLSDRRISQVESISSISDKPLRLVLKAFGSSYFELSEKKYEINET